MAKNELEMITKSANIVASAITDMLTSLSYMRLNESLRETERLKAEMLYKLTNGGKTAPYLQEYGVENVKFSLLMRKKIEEYNLTADPEDKVNFFFSETLDGHKVLWTDEQGAAKINDLRKELLIAFGDFYSEISPSELYRANMGNEVVTFNGVTEKELSILKSNMGPGGAAFSFATIPNGDGTYNVEVNKKDFIAGENREDFLVNLIRANTIENSAKNSYLCNELAYEKDLKERMINYDSESPTYVTSATDGGRYIKITKNEFSVYNVGLDANDVRQQIEQQVKLKDSSPEKYKDELYKAIISFNRPVEINDDIWKENEKQFENLYGKEGDLYARETKIQAAIMRDLEKTRMSFPSVRSKKAPDLLKQLERQANRSLAASIAAKIVYDKLNKGEVIDAAQIPEMLNRKEVDRIIRVAFFKEHLLHMQPDIHKEFIEQIKNTDLFKQFEAALVNPDLKDEMTKLIENSYEDFYFELNKPLQEKIKNEYRKFENEIKTNCEAAINKGVSKSTEQTIERIKNEETDKTLQIILAKCITGKTLEGIRPLQTDIQVLRNAEFDDELTRLFAQKLEKKLEEIIGEKNLSPDILKTEAYEEAVKATSEEILRGIKENTLKNESPKWMSVIKHADYIGGIDEEKLKEIADAAISIGDYDSKCREIQPQDLSWATDLEQEQPEKWEMLQYEHNEEKIGQILKESIMIEDVDLNGSIEKMQGVFHKKLEQYNIDDSERDVKGEVDMDLDFVSRNVDGEAFDEEKETMDERFDRTEDEEIPIDV